VSVFVDTSALIPLLVETDPDHPAVLAEFKGLLRGGNVLRTTSYVLVEASAVLQSRIGLPPVRALHESILPVLSMEWVSEQVHRKGLERHSRENRRSLSLVDCISFEVMDSEGIRQAFALDEHFDEAGYRTILRRRGTR